MLLHSIRVVCVLCVCLCIIMVDVSRSFAFSLTHIQIPLCFSRLSLANSRHSTSMWQLCIEFVSQQFGALHPWLSWAAHAAGARWKYCFAVPEFAGFEYSVFLCCRSAYVAVFGRKVAHTSFALAINCAVFMQYTLWLMRVFGVGIRQHDAVRYANEAHRSQCVAATKRTWRQREPRRCWRIWMEQHTLNGWKQVLCVCIAYSWKRQHTYKLPSYHVAAPNLRWHFTCFIDGISHSPPHADTYQP